MRHVMTAAAVSAALMASQALAAAPAAAPAKPAAPAATKAGPSDRAQIAALERGFMAAFNAKNVGRIMSYYDRNGLFVFDLVIPREYPSWASYEKDFQDIFAANPGPIDMKLSDLAITVVGDVAYGHSIQGGYFSDKAGKKTEMVVRVSDVYRKVGGRWKIVQEHVSVPIDLATGQPDMMSKP